MRPPSPGSVAGGRPPRRPRARIAPAPDPVAESTTATRVRRPGRRALPPDCRAPHPDCRRPVPVTERPIPVTELVEVHSVDDLLRGQPGRVVRSTEPVVVRRDVVDLRRLVLVRDDRPVLRCWRHEGSRVRGVSRRWSRVLMCAHDLLHRALCRAHRLVPDAPAERPRGLDHRFEQFHVAGGLRHGDAVADEPASTDHDVRALPGEGARDAFPADVERILTGVVGDAAAGDERDEWHEV